MRDDIRRYVVPAHRFFQGLGHKQKRPSLQQEEDLGKLAIAQWALFLQAKASQLKGLRQSAHGLGVENAPGLAADHREDVRKRDDAFPAAVAECMQCDAFPFGEDLQAVGEGPQDETLVGIAARDGVAVAIEVHHGHPVGDPPMRDGWTKGAKGQGAKSGLFLLPILPSFFPLPLTPLQ